MAYEFYGCLYIHTRYIPVLLVEPDNQGYDLIEWCNLKSYWDEMQDMKPELLKTDVAELELDDWTHGMVDDVCSMLRELHIPYDFEASEQTRYYRCHKATPEELQNASAEWVVDYWDTLPDSPMVHLDLLIIHKDKGTQELQDNPSALRLLIIEAVEKATPPMLLHKVPISKEIQTEVVASELIGDL